MSISVVCLGCDKKYRVKDEMAGKRIKCRACGQVVTIPGASPSGTHTASLAPQHSIGAGTPNSRKSALRYLLALIGGCAVLLAIVVGIVLLVLLLNRSDKTSVPNTVANMQSNSLVQNEPATDAVEIGEKGSTDPAVPIESRSDANSIADTTSPVPSDDGAASQQLEKPAPGTSSSSNETRVGTVAVASGKSGWEPKISRVEVRNEYTERNMFSNTITYEIRPEKSGLEIAVISISFQTPHVTPEQAQSKLKKYESLLPKEAYVFLSDPLEASGALLASSDLNVVWDNGETVDCMAFELTRFLTHAEADGKELLITRIDDLKDGDGNPIQPSLLRQLRLKDAGSYFWYRCGSSLSVTCIFPISKDIKSGKLSFCGELLPVELSTSMADTQPPVSSEVGVASSKIEKTAPLTAAKSSPPESPKADHASRAPAADTDAQSETGLTNNEAVPIQWAQFEQALKLLGVCASFQLVSNSAGSSVTVEEVAMLSNCRSYFKKTLLNKPLSNSLHSAMTYLDGINPSGSLQYVIVGGSETPAISAVKMVLGEERSKEVRGDLSQPLDSTSLRNDGPINMEAKPEKIVWYDYGRLRFGVLNGDVVGVFADPVAESSRLKNPQQGNTLADDASSKTVDDSAPPKASVKTDDTALQAPEWLVGRWEGLTEEKNECALVFERNDKRIAQVFIHAGENINFGVRAYTIDARSNMVRLPDDTFTAILVEANKLHVKANYGGSSYGAKVEIDMTMTRVKQSIP